MTIDERLDRLTERHEALTQSVELNGIQIRQNSRAIEALATENQRNARNIELLTANMRDFLTAMRNHESRISNLEQ